MNARRIRDVHRLPLGEVNAADRQLHEDQVNPVLRSAWSRSTPMSSPGSLLSARQSIPVTSASMPSTHLLCAVWMSDNAAET